MHHPCVKIVNGINNIIINNAGNVGIGTSSPQADLHLWGGNAGTDPAWNSQDRLILEADDYYYMQFFTPTTGNAQIQFSDTTRGMGRIVYNHNGDYMMFDTNQATALYIDSSQNVGIGTSSPEATLHIEHDGSGSTGHIIQGDISGDTGIIRAHISKSVTDASATTVFRINTTDESGAHDAGGYTVIVKGTIGHRLLSNGNGGAMKGFGAHFSRYMATSAGFNSAVTEDFETAEVCNDCGLRGIDTVTMSVTEVDEYTVDVQFYVDSSGSATPEGARVSLSIELIYEEFKTPPTISLV